MTDNRSLHLENLVNQQKQVVSEVNELNKQIEIKRETYLKLQGVIEYLTSSGVESSQEVKEDEL
tara:strand:- start:66 stop:257 length:192 start_codon:yes stop_codon:yes gene_type:complete